MVKIRFQKMLLFIVFCMVVITMVSISTITASAEETEVLYSGTCGTNLTWQIDDAGTLTIDGTGAMDSYSSDDSVPWSSYRSKITKIVLNNGIANISKYAFYFCNSLKTRSITIPDSVKSIGKYAFYYCNLVSVVVPNSVTFIDVSAFGRCDSLYQISLPFVGGYNSSDSRFEDIFGDPSAVSQYGSFVPNSLKKVTITGGTSIGYQAFYNCTSLTSITIPDSVTSIGGSAFYNCTSLNSITLPFVGRAKNGTSNTHFAYIFGASSNSYNNDYVPPSLKNVTITGGASIGDYAFEDCKSLTSIIIPYSVTSIGNNAFDGCTSLASITIPDSVTSIGRYAFWYCESLTSVIIPDSVTSISECVFYNCESLTSVIIPDGVTSIGNSAFQDCASLTSITIPGSVTSIGNYAFRYCAGLTSVIIYDGVTSIGNYAFKDCTSLTSITIPDSVTSIGNNAFDGCTRLRSITIPDIVTSIGEYAFRATGYYNNLSNWQNGVLYNGNHLIAADTSLSGAYVIKEGTKVIAASAFRDCESLTSVIIPKSVTNVGSYAFYGCVSLSSITFRSYITEIYDSSNTIYPGATIYFYSGSTADEYAAKYGRAFVELVCSHSFTKVADTTYIKSAATCASPAVYYKSCESCGKKGTETFEYGTAIKHSYTRKVVTDTYKKSAATCTNAAVYYYCCATCDIKGTTTYTNGTELGHTGGTATCTTKAKCTRCNQYYGEITEHIYTDQDATATYLKSAATCTSKAVYYKNCATCDKAGTATFEYGTTKAHSYTRKVVTDIYKKSAATCTSAAVYYYCCATCDAKGTTTYTNGSNLGHTGGTATCTAKAICSRCSQAYGSMREHVYTDQVATATYLKSAATCTSRAVYYKNCATCDKAGTATFEYGSLKAHSYVEKVENAYLKTSATCTNKAVYYKSCSACGVKGTATFEVGATLSHNYQVAWSSDATSHWHECSNCGDKKDIASHTAGAAATEYIAQTCTVCGYVITPALGHTHHYNTTWSNDADNHWYECSACGDKKNKAPHTPGADVTETTDQTCIVCGYIIKKAHRHAEGEWIIDKEATCTEDGSRHQICSVCGDTIKTETISKLEHTEGKWIIDKEATTTTEGSKHQICSVCGYTIKTEVIPKVTEIIGSCGDNLTWKLDLTTKTLTISGTGEMDDYTSDSLAPWESHDIKKVIIEDGVTSIGNYAFYGCSSLTSVLIGDSVTSIGDNAFYDCNSLTSIEIPDSVTSIGGYAFGYCRSLAIVKLPDGITSIGNCVFHTCSGLKSIEIPNSVTRIGNWAFANCSSLTGIEIPDSVTSIGQEAFSKCNSITSVTIPKSVTSIGNYAFSSCSSLKTIYLYRNSAADSYFSSSYTKIYLDAEPDVPEEPDPDAFKVVLEAGSVNADGTFIVNVVVYNNPGVAGYQFDLVFDNTKVQVVDVIRDENNDPESAFPVAPTLNIDEPTYNSATADRVSSNAARAKAWTKKNGVLLSVIFKFCEGVHSADLMLEDEMFVSADAEKIYAYVGSLTVRTPYTITYDANGGEGAPSSVKTHSADYTISSVIPVKTGYSFMGWNGSDGKIYNVGEVYSANVNLTLTAIWKAQTYTLTFDALSGNLDITHKQITFDTAYGDLPTPTKANYTFGGWFLETEYKNKLTSDTVVTIANDHTAYAMWIPVKYTVIYYANGGEGAPASQTKDFGINLVLSNAIPTRKDYTFKGWAITADGEVVYAPGGTYTENAPLTLYAIWEKTAYGDANGDGVINAKDSVLLAQHLAGWDVELDISAADCNGDGNVNAKDSVLLAQHLAGWDVTLG